MNRISGSRCVRGVLLGFGLIIAVFVSRVDDAFAATVDIDGSVSAADYVGDGQYLSNVPVFLSSQAFSTVTSTTFSVTAVAGDIVTCDAFYTQSSSVGEIRFYVSGDETSTSYGTTEMHNSGSTPAGATSASSGLPYCRPMVGTTAVNGFGTLHISYMIDITSPNAVLFQSNAGWMDSGTVFSTSVATCYEKNGGSGGAPQKLVLYTTAGTFIGKVACTKAHL